MFFLALAILSFFRQQAFAGKIDDREGFFEARIRPVLVGVCQKCHRAEKPAGGLSLDGSASLLKGGGRGPAIVPGDPEASLLIKAIRHTDEKLRMPPDGRIEDRVIHDFETWIQDGAHWPVSGNPSFNLDASAGHWAFLPIVNSDPPAGLATWSNHPIDRFISAKWAPAGLNPAPPATKQEMIRRLYFDLVGLPPSPDEIAEFLADDSPEAYSKLVERLLASPRYGERWGRHWMDVVRYADTAGDNADYPVPELRRYRDYIINAFNADLPFDQFVVEQLAGDILAEESPGARSEDQKIATGFLALSRRYGTAPYELWHLTLEDTIDTFGRAFLGLSLRCARCHDHKFDPVTMRDYYALYGIFNSTQFPWAGGEEFQSKNFPRQDFVSLLSPQQTKQKLAPFHARSAALKVQIAALELGLEKENPAVKEMIKQQQAELASHVKFGMPEDFPWAYAVREGTPADAHLQYRGNPGDQKEPVPRNAPEFLAPGDGLKIPLRESGRLQLAQWLTRSDHPLFARVMINRIWQHHFGEGIVRTPSNFGLRGEAPTHPELLDFLAVRFIEETWSIKAMHRFIVSSKTYQLSSHARPEMLAKDPDNRLLASGNRRRLDAESIRDAMLAVSGGLEAPPVGDHPFPPIRDWHWTQHNAFKANYPSRARSVYLMTQRLQRHPFLSLFDGPDTNTSTDRRTSATVPLQALYLMNDPFVTEQSRRFAEMLVSQVSDPAARIEAGYRRALGRESSPAEVAKTLEYLEKFAAASRAAGATAEQAEIEAWSSFAKILLMSNEFVYVD